MDNGVRYLIHKIGTRKIDLRGAGMVYTLPAPEYWHDNPRGGQWGAASTATVYTSMRAVHLPDRGEWVSIYVNEDACLECGNSMSLEGKIQDELKLCHGCYSNETLAKFYPAELEDQK